MPFSDPSPIAAYHLKVNLFFFQINSDNTNGDAISKLIVQARALGPQQVAHRIKTIVIIAQLGDVNQTLDMLVAELNE